MQTQTNAQTVLFIDDEVLIRRGGEQALDLAGLSPIALETAERAFPLLSSEFTGVVVCDVRLPGMSGLELLKWVQGVDREIPFIIVTGHGDISMAVQAMRDGAYDFLEKPYASGRLVEVVQRGLDKRQLVLENRRLRSKLDQRVGIDATLLGNSPAIKEVRRLVADLADAPADVLIHGETGSGKEMVAYCLHHYSRRRDNHFVALNCAGLPESVFESEMFGHEAGAFTGAIKRRVGKIEHAHGGTLFLDEIETMPMNLQAKLLRVLQDKKVERLGSNDAKKVDFRIIAATKSDLKTLSDEGKFRSDLYYRLGVVMINLPPLRERREDIPMLFDDFVLKAAERFGREPQPVNGDQLHELLAHDWPGNVRELKNVADRFALGLRLDHLISSESTPQRQRSLPEQVEEFERQMIEGELKRQGGKVAAASETLKIPKKTLYDKLRRYGIKMEGE